jgi:3-deoxy-D-manno-octulosonate 8-phosphate phosphatase (KDO 8-P phosphatase)
MLPPNKTLNDIKLVVYDFDGVMTDNRVMIDGKGNEYVYVSRADGLGIDLIKKIQISQLILSSETNPIVEVRANKLKIPVLYGIENKKITLKEYCKSNNFFLENVLYVGNDLNDLEVMKIVGYTFCPKDAHPDIIDKTSHLLNSNGGHGVVREIADILYSIKR